MIDRTPPPPITTDERARLLKLATNASVAVASLLIVAKLAAWMYTGSVTVLASLVDSLMDVFASLINLFAVRYSLQPADAEHRFGHGKAESLAGLAQATFIAGSAVFLMLEALDRFRHPQPLAAVEVGIGVMVFAILATLGLLAVQRYVIRKTGSTAIGADALHYATDLVTNLGTILALVLAAMGWGGADPLFAIAIAAYILYSALSIAREAVSLLMDRELPDEVREQMVEIAFKPPEVLGVHDLRSRQSGGVYFVEIHIEMDDALSLQHAHAVAERVEQNILRAFPNAEIIVHQDPVSQVDHDRVRVEPRPQPPGLQPAATDDIA